MTRDLAAHLSATLVLVAGGFLGLIVARRALRSCTGSLSVPILVVAALLRVLLLPLPPTLSDDVYRYVWDGRVVRAGLNPYRLAPLASELAPLRDPLWEGLSHRDVPTVYPPLAQAVFAAAASLPGSVYVLKGLLIIADLGTCVLLLKLAAGSRVSAGRAIWYAWNPLVTVEVAGMGHVDGFGVMAAVLATALLTTRSKRVVPAAGAAATAVLAKLVPVVAFPIWARLSRRPGAFLALAGGLVLAGLVPVAASTGGMPRGLLRYGISWEFNGPLFEPLWRILDRTELDVGVEAGLDRLKIASGDHEFWNRFYPFNYPRMWARVALVFGLGLSLIWSWRTSQPFASLRRIFGSVLLFSATVYPWYALWVLPWAALSHHRAWLALSGLLWFSYLPQFSTVPLFPWIHALIWLPFFLLVGLERRWSTP